MLNPKVRAWLEMNGLGKEASEAEARGMLVALKARGVEPVDPIDIDDPQGGQRSAGGTVPPEGNDQEAQEGGEEGGRRSEDAQLPAGDNQASAGGGQERSAALIAEAERLEEIDLYLRAYPAAEGMRGQFLSDQTYTGQKLRQAVADFVSGSSRKMDGGFGGAARWQFGQQDESDRLRAAMVGGLLQRAGRPPASVDAKTGAPEQQQGYAPGSESFRGMSLLRIGSMLLRSAGVAVDRMSDHEIAERMLQRSPQTSYDFPLLMGEYLNKSLAGISAYMDRDWLPCVKEVSASDFRTRHPMEFGGANKFGVRQENGDFPVANYKESGESYTPHMEGLKTILTLEMILHDDLNAFGEQRMNEMYAQAESEREQFFALLAANPVMSDGNALLSAAHGNISTVDMIRDDFDSTTAALQALRIRMRKQVTATGMKTRIKPRTLLCDLNDHDNLFQRVSKPEIASTSNMVGTANPNYGMQVIDSDEVTLAFYAFGDPKIPGQAAIEASWYLGNKDGNSFSKPHYAGLHVEYLVWSGFGLGVVSHVGIDKTTVSLT